MIASTETFADAFVGPTKIADQSGFSLQFTIHRDGALLLLNLCGELDLHTCGPLRTALIEALRDSSCTDLVADMSRLTYLDSGGVGIFVNAMQLLQPRTGRVYLVACLPLVKRILSVTRLSRIFCLRDSLDEVHASPRMNAAV